MTIYSVLRYLTKTKHDGLTFRRHGNPIYGTLTTLRERYPKIPDVSDCPFVLFSDADFADARDERLRYTSGFVVFCFGSLVHWVRNDGR